MDYKPTILEGGEKRSDDQIMAAHATAGRRASSPGLPGGDDDSPLVIMELLQRLRVSFRSRSGSCRSPSRKTATSFRSWRRM